MKALLFPLGLITLGLSLPARAEIYKCTDASGIATFTDNPRSFNRKQCVSMNMDPVVVISAPPKRDRSSGSGTRSTAPRPETPSPANFPRVDSSTQKQRDMTRRQVLQEEMETEQRLLEASQRALDAAQRQPAMAAQLPQLRNEVIAHQKNIEALQKELARVR